MSKFFERNLAVFKQIFSRYMHFGKECMDITEALEFVFKIGEITNVSDRQVVTMFAYSKLPVVDLLKHYKA